MRRLAKVLFISLGIVFIVCIAVVIFIFSWRGSSKPIEAAANKFVAPASWHMDKNEIHPPTIICWNGYACPSVWRGWHVPDTTTFGQIEAFAKSTAVDMRVENSCSAAKHTSIANSPCAFYGNDSRYSYSVLISIPSDHDLAHVYIGVDPVNRQ